MCCEMKLPSGFEIRLICFQSCYFALGMIKPFMIHSSNPIFFLLVNMDFDSCYLPDADDD